MDVVVVLFYLLACSSTLVSAALRDTNLSIYAVLVLATATVFMFRRDKPLAVLVIVSIFELLNVAVTSAAGNVGISIWFALYTVATRYRPLFSFPIAVASTTPLGLYTLVFYQFPSEYLLSE